MVPRTLDFFMAIALNNVRFYYPDQRNKPVLDIPQWLVASGERLFLHGPSGTGKSTLLNLLSGLLHAGEGQVEVLGQRLDKMTRGQRDRFRAEHIGYVFQQFNLIPYLDAVDNIRVASQFAKKTPYHQLRREIENLLDALHISRDDWQAPANRLSIGQQQRVAIARALINKPKLLIADEPTSSLDCDNRDAFLSLLMELTADHGITLLFVSHDLSLAHYFERVDALSDINRAGSTSSCL